MPLRNFSDSEVIIDQHEAFFVLRFFWIEPGLVPSQLTTRDRAFAQALLLEAIDSSYNMGFVEIIFRTFYGKVPDSFSAISDIVKSFAKDAAKHWFAHATGEDLKDPKIYESVRRTIARNFRSVWLIRLKTDELTY